MRSENFDEMVEILKVLEESFKKEKWEIGGKTGYGDWEERNKLEVFEEENEEEGMENREVIVEGGKEGVVIKDFGEGSYLVRLKEPEDRIMVFSADMLRLKKGQFKPGDIVRRKGEIGGEEYSVSEVDEAVGKAKIKSKVTGEEQIVDVEYLEKVSQRRPYEVPAVEIKPEEGEVKEVEEKDVEEKPEVKEKPEEEVAKKEEEVIEKDVVEEKKADEVLLTETVKTILSDPEIAVMIVEKLLDVVTARGLEKEFVERLSKAGYEVSDLYCLKCLKKDGIKVLSVFEAVLKEGK